MNQGSVDGSCGRQRHVSREVAQVQSGRRKKVRMPFIAVNGLLVLVPCAVLLNRWAAADSFDAAFCGVQAIELVAGEDNLALKGLNARGGLRIAGRLRSRPTAATKAH